MPDPFDTIASEIQSAMAKAAHERAAFTLVGGEVWAGYPQRALSRLVHREAAGCEDPDAAHAFARDASGAGLRALPSERRRRIRALHDTLFGDPPAQWRARLAAPGMAEALADLRARRRRYERLRDAAAAAQAGTAPAEGAAVARHWVSQCQAAMLLRPVWPVAPREPASAFGGLPHLPADIAWPVGRHGQPMRFWLQLACGDTTPDVMPPTGRLLVFLDVLDDGQVAGSAVLHVETGAPKASDGTAPDGAVLVPWWPFEPTPLAIAPLPDAATATPNAATAAAEAAFAARLDAALPEPVPDVPIAEVTGSGQAARLAIDPALVAAGFPGTSALARAICDAFAEGIATRIGHLMRRPLVLSDGGAMEDPDTAARLAALRQAEAALADLAPDATAGTLSPVEAAQVCTGLVALSQGIPREILPALRQGVAEGLADARAWADLPSPLSALLTARLAADMAPTRATAPILMPPRSDPAPQASEVRLLTCADTGALGAAGPLSLWIGRHDLAAGRWEAVRAVVEDPA